jgi:hypothetical protein
MKNLLFIGVIIFMKITHSHCQDEQWYVKNFNGKSANSSTFNNTITSNNFKINNICPCVSCTPAARKDLFIIYDDGTHTNTRLPNNIAISSSISCPSSNPTSNPSYFTFIGPKRAQYLYLSNIYQGDDPPQYVSVYNYGATGDNVLTRTSNTASNYHITANHDILEGKDITLIIPKKLFDTCGMHPILDLELDLSFFQTSNVFINPNTTVPDWVYYNQPSAAVSISNNKITGLTLPSNNTYQYLNFKTPENIPDSLLGTTKKFTLYCSSNNMLVDESNEKIGHVHDPNYIKVECFTSKYNSKSKTTSYFVKYKVQFMNDGNQMVHISTVNFNLPSVVLPGSFRAGNWSYGNKSQCGQKSEMKVTVTGLAINIVFNPNNDPNYFLAAQSSTSSNHSRDQYGWLEFCVEVKQNPNAYNFVDLRPTDAQTDFDGHAYYITDFIDPHVVDVRNNSNPNCNCNCKIDYKNIKRVPKR